MPTQSAQALRYAFEFVPRYIEPLNLRDLYTLYGSDSRETAARAASHATSGSPSIAGPASGDEPNTQMIASPSTALPRSRVRQASGATSQRSVFGRSSSMTAGNTQTDPDPRYLYFCIESGISGGTFRYSVIETHRLDHDPQFFRQLKQEYVQARGWIREWFSWWRYDHCAIYQFQKFASELSEPVVVGFPSETDPEYDFQPSPLEPHSRPPYGPILKSEYRHRFYTSCTSCHSWHILHQQRKGAYNQADPSRIRVLPKRKQEVDMTDSESEVFWGIIARERRGFAWVGYLPTAVLQMHLGSYASSYGCSRGVTLRTCRMLQYR